jgi:hypothetical protein
MNQIRTLTPNLLKIHLNIIHLPAPSLQRCLVPPEFVDKILYTFLYFSMDFARPAHLNTFILSAK